MAALHSKLHTQNYYDRRRLVMTGGRKKTDSLDNLEPALLIRTHLSLLAVSAIVSSIMSDHWQFYLSLMA